jgi:hypothetical protein
MTADDTTHADCEKFGVPNNREVEALKYPSSGETTFDNTVSAVEYLHVGPEQSIYKICNFALVFVEASTDVGISELHSAYVSQLGTAACHKGYDIGPDVRTICSDGIERAINKMNSTFTVSE